jgi:hypothetical protein
MVVHTCNPSIQEVEAGGVRILGHSGLHSEALSLKEEEGGREGCGNLGLCIPGLLRLSAILAGDRVSSAPSSPLLSLVDGTQQAGRVGWVDSHSQVHLPKTCRSQAYLREAEGGKEGPHQNHTVYLWHRREGEPKLGETGGEGSKW